MQTTCVKCGSKMVIKGRVCGPCKHKITKQDGRYEIRLQKLRERYAKDKAFRTRILAAGTRWRRIHRKQMNSYSLKHYYSNKTNPSMMARRKREAAKCYAAARDNLKDSYVKHALRACGWTSSDITPGIIEIKRSELQLARRLRELRMPTIQPQLPQAEILGATHKRFCIKNKWGQKSILYFRTLIDAGKSENQNTQTKTK